MFSFTPFPVIATEKLILRRISSEDQHDLFQMRKDPRMHEHTDTKPDEKLTDTLLYIEKMKQGVAENKWIIWAIEHRSSQKVIGTISVWGLNSEQRSGQLGYGIIPEYQGRGLMKEALLSVIDHSFKVIKLRTLEAYTEEANVASIKLLESCHFKEQKRVEDKGYIQDRIYKMIVYRIGKEREGSSHESN